MKARNTAVACIAAAGALWLAPTALANGPCGINYDAAHACGITTPYATNQTITTDNAQDYYAFWGAEGTQVVATISKTSTFVSDTGNGEANLELLDTDGNEQGDSAGAWWDVGYVPHSATIAHTLDATGVWYLRVYGGTGVPYSLDVTANPGVQWPAPAPVPVPTPVPTPKPRCIVPHYRGKTLGKVERRIVKAHCAVGRVRKVRSRTRRGIVIGLTSAPGKRRSNGAHIGVTVSKGRGR